MRATVTLAGLMLATSMGCARPNFDEPDPLPIGNSPGHGSGRQASASAPSASGSGEVLAPSPSGSAMDRTDGDAGALAMRWKGALNATTPVQFGGGPNCVYRITLQNVKVDIVAAANGDIVAANVSATALEQVVTASCANSPIPPHTHTYALVTASVLPNGLDHLELVGLATNHPAASLVIEGDLRVPLPSLSLAWHRTDYGPPLDWRINARITAVAQ